MKLQMETRDLQETPVWDCGSSLYDSFELHALEQQVDSAIASRTLSMPHLSDGRLRQPPTNRQSGSRVSRAFQRVVRSVFRLKGNSSYVGNGAAAVSGGLRGFYDRSAVLSTIPEGSEIGGVSPEMKRSSVVRTPSGRFTAASSLGVSC